MHRSYQTMLSHMTQTNQVKKYSFNFLYPNLTLKSCITPYNRPYLIQSRSFFGFNQTAEEVTLDISVYAREIHETVLSPLNKSLLGPLEKHSDQLTPKPMVFVLGNHSSGKSTFINYVVGRDVQTAGVAPTDDSFTVVIPGHEDVDQDGPALIGDPDLGFEGLRSFGSSLINHVNLKVRNNLQVKDIMLVDSPGMIDSPISHRSGDYYDRISTNASPRDRGYNFPGVVRWFAERADVILLFFDPDKPGTTGETLACMTNALVGLDHKLHIILNKVDQFKNVHDFARAYGSLCWNLSKVIPRKDLPRIYTMCLPTSSQGKVGGPGAQSLKEAMNDLESARREIVFEVSRAPSRRADNVITRLYDSARQLRMHTQMLEQIRREYRRVRRLYMGSSIASGTATAVITGGLLFGGIWEAAIPSAILGTAITGALIYSGNVKLTSMQNAYLNSENTDAMDKTFRDVHYLSLAEKDDFVVSLYEMIKPQLQRSLRTFGLSGIPKIRNSDIAALDHIIEEDVPKLRRQATKAASFEDAEAEQLTAEIEASASRQQTNSSSSASSSPKDEVSSTNETITKDNK